MRGLRNLSIALIMVLLFTLAMVVIGALSRGVRAGKVDPRLLAGAVTGLTAVLVIAVFAALIRLVHKHKKHREQASSADILAEIIAMKEPEKNQEKENGDHDRNDRKA
ncbi:hypothetical protein [Ruminococcus sp.]|uniref:hypothetical protein n=1 Tax=Ruminococcus sp. TaxID=41978 RepID=UPI0025F1E874|nr:hypothetical protein [Ruminococcus sp.]MBQ8966180.1 hypothetical protein [Ruminococcus sp.]